MKSRYTLPRTEYTHPQGLTGILVETWDHCFTCVRAWRRHKFLQMLVFIDYKRAYYANQRESVCWEASVDITLMTDCLDSARAKSDDESIHRKDYHVPRGRRLYANGGCIALSPARLRFWHWPDLNAEIQPHAPHGMAARTKCLRRRGPRPCVVEFADSRRRPKPPRLCATARRRCGAP